MNTNLLRNGQPFEGCANHNNAVFERYIASATPRANGVVVWGAWQIYRFVLPDWATVAASSGDSVDEALLGGISRTLDLLSRSQVRTLVIAPLPFADSSSFECVYWAASRHKDETTCSVYRDSIEAERAGMLKIMREKVEHSSNMRLIDPADALCDAKLCHGSLGGVPLHDTMGHLSPAAARLVYMKFKSDFDWVTDNRDAR